MTSGRYDKQGFRAAQVSYIFPMFGRQAYINVKGCYEFAAKNSMEGWNGWITLAIPLTTPKMAAPPPAQYVP